MSQSSLPRRASSYNVAMTIQLKGLTREQVTNLLPEGLISLCWRGSVAHGMYVPKSDPDSIDDKDVMGVYIAPIAHYLGFGRQDVFEKWEGEGDCVFYELRKFIGLLLNCNPNVLSLLWLKPNGLIYESSLGRLLRENRDLFVPKNAYHSFSGYAHDQFKKMISFNQEGAGTNARTGAAVIGIRHRSGFNDGWSCAKDFQWPTFRRSYDRNDGSS